MLVLVCLLCLLLLPPLLPTFGRLVLVGVGRPDLRVLAHHLTHAGAAANQRVVGEGCKAEMLSFKYNESSL